MVFLAGLLHGLIILGLTFNAAGEKSSAKGLEVLLVSDDLPAADKNPGATYLAQRTQLGSGNTQLPAAPHNLASAVPAVGHEGTPRGDSLTSRGERAGSREPQLLTTTAWSTDVRYLADAGSSGATHDLPLLVDEHPTAQPGPQDDQGPPTLRGPKRDELWISPGTRAPNTDPYLDSWRRKVERIGTLNYPTAARSAPESPEIEVGITSNGALDRVVIRRSSGNPQLDAAALAILKLASPFDPFPPELATEHEVLRFVYVWQFTGGRLTSGNVTAVP